MKYLICGDIHGNLPALENVLRKENGNYDHIVSHGDVVNYGPWSNECCELLLEQPYITTLKGNHEEAFISGKYPGENEIAKTFFNFCFPRFENFDIIESYRESIDLGRFEVRHSYEGKYFYPDTDFSGYEFEKDLIIGHSHYQFKKNLNRINIINTGSIGQNRKVINISEYILYDTIKQEIELKSLIYDFDALISQMEAEDFPEVCLNYYKKKPRI